MSHRVDKRPQARALPLAPSAGRAKRAHGSVPSHAAPRGWRGSPWVVVGTLTAVIAAVAVMLAVGLGGATPKVVSQSRAPANVVDAATHPNPGALTSVGATGATNPFVTLPATTPSLTVDGRPQLVYVSADYCPFCAARRWSLVVALSRFGTFSNLALTSSSSTDIYPNTSSFSFHGAGYTSQYISLATVETETRDRKALETPSADVARVFEQYDVPPYTTQAGAIPFLDIGGRFLSIGGGYSPSLLQGMSAQQIASVIRNPNSPVGRAIMADANVITAAVCSVTGNQPGSVCGVAPMPQIVAALEGR
jgi:uncharacterized protein DUF929